MQKEKGKLNEHPLKSGDEARGERLVQTVADAALDCGDAEVICEWMEPKRPWSSAWWLRRGPVDDVATEANSRHVPRVLDLDALWEVEERLTDDQVCSYNQKLDWATKSEGHNNKAPAAVFPWHAKAEQKIKALAAVIRNASPQSSNPHRIDGLDKAPGPGLSVSNEE